MVTGDGGDDDDDDNGAAQRVKLKSALVGTTLAKVDHGGHVVSTRLQDRLLHPQRQEGRRGFEGLVASRHEDGFVCDHGDHNAYVMGLTHKWADGGECESGGATCGAVEGRDALQLH